MKQKIINHEEKSFKNYELCVQAAAKQENSLGENLFLKIITILG